ncbi:MAG TPA: SwmB domain-containing protein, partial [Candidatus Limnocylindrales bacterium]|nr:SwmB domain-containing protein [Candidatus Limnocylindrales bacterium]
QVRGTTLAFDAIDEGLGAADTTTYLQNQTAVSGRAFFLLTDMPSTFTSMASVSISIRARTVGVTDDQTTLFAQLVGADETTPLSGEVLVATNPGPGGWVTAAAVTFPSVAAGTKAGWDGARLRLRWAYTQIGSADSTQLRLTVAELHGTYDSGGGPPPDLTPPLLTGASVDGASLTLTYDEALDPGSVPASAAFGVLVDSSPRAVSAVAIVGSTATLSLASAVVAGQTVTASYTVPGTNPLQDAAGNDSVAFSGRSVTNTTPGGGGGGGGGGTAGLPTLLPNGDGTRTSSIQVRGTTLAFDAINEGLGAADTSTYLQNGQRTNGTAFVQISDTPADFTSMSSLSVSIRARTRGFSNDQTRLFAQLFDANETTPLSAELLVATNPGTSSWTTVSNVAFTGLTPGSKATWDVARMRLRWAYTQVGTADSTQLRVSVAELHGTYSATAPPPDLQAPLLTGATVSGATVTLDYNEPLDPASTPAPSDYTIAVGPDPRAVTTVFVAGSHVSLTLATPVVSGDSVTASYVVPGTGPVQDQAGNDAAAFSASPVSNITPPSGGAVNASGNEITDVVRTGGVQGDGRPADSSYGIWEAATNLDTNGGFENASSAGWTATGASVASSNEQARFGSLSGKVVASSAGDAVAKSVSGLTAATTYSRSLWIYRTETASTLTVSALNNAATGTLASATVPAALGWSRVAVRAKTETGQTTLTTRITS